MYQVTPSALTGKLPENFFEKENAPPSRAQRECETPTPEAEKSR